MILQQKFASMFRLLGCAAISLVASQSVMSVDVEPPLIEFKDVQKAATINVTNDGTPVSASEIQSVKLYVAGHDYDHMITVSKADGKVTVQPTEQLQLGTYDLVIMTAHGSAKVAVEALLGIVDASLEARATRQGITVDAVKAQLGMSQTLQRQDRISLNIPKVYYLGQSLKIDMPAPEGRTAVWMVNGEAIAPRNGEFTYVFEQIGVYDFAYVEKVEEATVAVALSTVQVVPEPPLPVTVASGTGLTLHAPEGFNRYEWQENGSTAGTEAAWNKTFTSTGKREVSVRASEPAPGTDQAFRVVTYTVTVQ